MCCCGISSSCSCHICLRWGMPFHGFARKHFPFRWSLPFQMLPASILKRRRLAFGLGVHVCTNDAPFFLIPHTNRRGCAGFAARPMCRRGLSPSCVSHVLAPKHTFHALPANMDFALRRILPKRHPDLCPGSIFFVPARALQKTKPARRRRLPAFAPVFRDEKRPAMVEIV